MWRKHAAFVLALALAMTAPSVTKAQAGEKVVRIGILRPGSPPDPFVETFRQALQDLGYAEGRNLSIEIRWAEGRDERLPGLAAELVRLKVDVIVAGGRPPVVAARQATATIPIVTPVVGDPVRLGLAASLARPGGNVTGLTALDEELPGKWMELLKEALPKVSRVALLWDTATDQRYVGTSEGAARTLGCASKCCGWAAQETSRSRSPRREDTALKPSSSCRPHSSMHAERNSSRSRPSSGCRRSTTRRNSWWAPAA